VRFRHGRIQMGGLQAAFPRKAFTERVGGPEDSL